MAAKDLSSKPKINAGQWLTIAVALTYFIMFTIITVGRHRAMETHTLDLVNMDQAVWNTINGRPLEISTVPGIDTRLGRHFEPILLPISLLYLLYNNAETLLIVQTAVIALGALPVYWLTQKKLQNQWIAVLFATLYLLYPSIQGVNNFDFHPVALSAPFLLFTIHAVETERRWQALLFATLAMSGKENVPLVIVMLGLFVLVFRKDKKLGLTFVVGGFAWFIIAFQFIIPHFVASGFSAYSGRYARWGSSQQEMIITLLSHPGDVWAYLTQPIKLTYYRDMLFPFAFTALLAPQWLLVSAPILAINLLSSVSGQSIADKNHYVSAIIPAIVVASIYGSGQLVHVLQKYARLKRAWVLPVLGIVLLTTMLHQQYYRGYSPLAYTFSWPRPDEHDAIGQSVLAQIPADASVSAQTDLGPQISHREELYLFPRLREAEYVVLDVTSGLFPLRYYEDYVTTVTDTLNNGYGIIDGRDGYLLLKKGTNNQQIPPDFYTFAISDPNYQPQSPIEANFGSGLRLLGYDFQQHRNTTLHIITYWQADNSTTDANHINLHITGENDKRLFTRTARTTYWFPPKKWPANTIVAVDFGVIGLSGSNFERISLSVSATTPEDKPIHPIQIVSSPMKPPLVHDASQVHIGDFCYERTILRECHKVRTFAIPDAIQLTNQTFGQEFSLVGYQLDHPIIHAGETLAFTLYWQSLTTTKTNYTVFAHLTENEPWLIHGQGDQSLWHGAYPSSWWEPDEIVADNYQITINDEISPGRYLLRIGLYNEQNGERLSILNGIGNILEDHIVLSEIIIEATD